MDQMALPLGWPPAEADDAFIVTDANRQAVAHFAHHGTWPVMATILTGPRKSGRSLLARLTVRRLGGALIDDAERHDERAIFAAWNDAQATRRPLIIVAHAAPPEWQVRLPDLRSRLSATPVTTIGQPDQELLAALLTRLLERRGLMVTTEVANYAATHTERSYVALLDLVERIDAAALAKRRSVTMPLVRNVLKQRQRHVA